MTGTVLRSIPLLVAILSTAIAHAGNNLNTFESNPNRQHYDYYDRSSYDEALLKNVEWKHLGKGLERMREGLYPRAFHDARFILNHFPNHPDGLIFLSRLSLLTGEHEWADDYFPRALQLYPDHGQTHAIYATYLYKRDMLDKAIEHYNRAIDLGHNKPYVNYNLGLAYFDTGKYKEARIHANQAYNNGYPLSGLKDKLRSVDEWRDKDKPGENTK